MKEKTVTKPLLAETYARRIRGQIKKYALGSIVSLMEPLEQLQDHSVFVEQETEIFRGKDLFEKNTFKGEAWAFMSFIRTISYAYKVFGEKVGDAYKNKIEKRMSSRQGTIDPIYLELKVFKCLHKKGFGFLSFPEIEKNPNFNSPPEAVVQYKDDKFQLECKSQEYNSGHPINKREFIKFFRLLINTPELMSSLYREEGNSSVTLEISKKLSHTKNDMTFDAKGLIDFCLQENKKAGNKFQKNREIIRFEDKDFEQSLSLTAEYNNERLQFFLKSTENNTSWDNFLKKIDDVIKKKVSTPGSLPTILVLEWGGQIDYPDNFFSLSKKDFYDGKEFPGYLVCIPVQSCKTKKAFLEGLQIDSFEIFSDI